MKLLGLLVSKAKGKKYAAVFRKDDGSRKTVNFGARDYEDYTQHHDATRRDRYLLRHQHENWEQPDTPGALSAWILWGQYTDIRKNLNYFKKHFSL